MTIDDVHAADEVRAASRRRRIALVAAAMLTVSLGAGGPAAADPEPLASTEVAFTQVSAGATHGVAVGRDGKAYSWGYNIQGRLGDGTGESRLSPVAVDAADLKLDQVSAALSHSLALTTDGTVYAWGAGSQGKLGDGAVVDRLSPVRVQIPDTEQVVSVDAGKYHSLALTDDGDIYAWGAGSQGQLGNNAKVDVSVPVKTQRPDGVAFVQVSAGEQNSSAIGDNGVVYSWGYNNRGQLGTGSTTAVSVPPP
ncbi:RCC1 domain-containing protein [Aeromicrobium sp. UC242_57]|uniref:RCC1 domain-containing protein n=1 Tax=Aeromicrobium sp. UC242_57 TaxID=3374624 RepID=UPI0037A3A403